MHIVAPTLTLSGKIPTSGMTEKSILSVAPKTSSTFPTFFLDSVYTNELKRGTIPDFTN